MCTEKYPLSHCVMKCEILLQNYPIYDVLLLAAVIVEVLN